MDSEFTKLRVATLNLLNNPKLIRERVQMVVEELKVIQPDILCLQEVLHGISFKTANYIAEEMGYGYVLGEKTDVKYEGVSHGNLTFTKYPIVKSKSLGTVVPSNEREVEDLAVTIDMNGQSIEVINAHFAWGGYPETYRNLEVKNVEKHARKVQEARPESLVILCGDLNCTPDSDTIRFLDGKTTLGSNMSTLWTDAYDTAGSPENYATTRVDNEFARTTAQSVGIKYPDMIPTRRIDYIKTLGYNYGRNGSPLAFGRWADTATEDGLTISDHRGLWADLLIL